jgi:hypothetical protein
MCNAAISSPRRSSRFLVSDCQFSQAAQFTVQMRFSVATTAQPAVARAFFAARAGGSDESRSSATKLPGQELAFGLVLIGRAPGILPTLVVALREMDRIGCGRRAIELTRIEASDLGTPRRASSTTLATISCGGARSPLTLEDCACEPCPRLSNHRPAR